MARQLKVDADVETWLQGDIDFHRALSVGAPQAARMAEDTRVRVHRYLRVAVTGESRRTAVIAEHRTILDAVEQGDAAAAEAALRKHIGGTRAVLVEYLRRPSGGPAGSA